jgi:hypothetical protein
MAQKIGKLSTKSGKSLDSTGKTLYKKQEKPLECFCKNIPIFVRNSK